MTGTAEIRWIRLYTEWLEAGWQQMLLGGAVVGIVSMILIFYGRRKDEVRREELTELCIQDLEKASEYMDSANERMAEAQEVERHNQEQENKVEQRELRVTQREQRADNFDRELAFRESILGIMEQSVAEENGGATKAMKHSRGVVLSSKPKRRN